MTKTFIVVATVIALLLTTAVIVGAYNHYYRYSYYRPYSSYSPYYAQPSYAYPYYSYPSYRYQYTYYPSYSYPSYYYPYYSAPSPLSSRYVYRYGTPATEVAYYPTTQPTTQYPSGSLAVPRGMVGQLCGLIDSTQYGCEAGLVCDYTKAEQSGIGVCSVQ